MFKFIRDNQALLAVSWGHFMNDFYMSVIQVVMFAFAIELDLTATQISLVVFVVTTAGTFFQPLIGLLIDRVQKSSLLIYGLIGISFGMSMAGLITNYYLLILVVGISALGSSIYHPLGSTITIHKTSLSRGKSLSIFMTIGSFAHSAAPIIAIPLVEVYGVKSIVFLVIPGIITALLLYLTGVHKVRWTKEEKNEDSKKKANLTQSLQLSIPMMIAVGKGVLYRVTLVFGVIIMGLRGIDSILAATVITGFMIARASATLIGGFVSDSIGEKKTLIVFNTLGLISVVMIVYGGNILLVLGYVLLGLSLNGTSAANITITHKIMPNNINYGTGLIMGFSATISAVAMLGYGIVVDQIGHLKSLNILTGIAIILMVISYMIPNRYHENIKEKVS